MGEPTDVGIGQTPERLPTRHDNPASVSSTDAPI
jgi:hypothetical protein